MRQTIRVEAMLREAVRTPYCDLVTRSTGRAVRTSIQLALAAAGGGVALLDFAEVGLVDFSCADEVIAKLLLNPPAETTIVLQNLSEAQLEAITHVLDHHALAALVQDQESGAARVVGRVSAELRTAFVALQAGADSAITLAERTGWPAGQAEAALAALTALRVVLASEGRYAVPLVS